MATLNDPSIIEMLTTAFQERACHSYVHWDIEAQQELEKTFDNITTAGVTEAVVKLHSRGERPRIEIQKADSGFEGEPRYTWRVTVEGVRLYVKVRVERDHLNEPMVTFVRCHE